MSEPVLDNTAFVDFQVPETGPAQVLVVKVVDDLVQSAILVHSNRVLGLHDNVVETGAKEAVLE
jgi:hypothetical protein